MQRRLDSLSNVPQPGQQAAQSQQQVDEAVPTVISLNKGKRRCAFCKEIGHTKTTNTKLTCPLYIDMKRRKASNTVCANIIESNDIYRVSYPPHIMLWKFPQSISQSTFERGNRGSNACALISMIFAHKFMSQQLQFNSELLTLPNVIKNRVTEAIRECNERHDSNFNVNAMNLDADDVNMHLADLGVTKCSDEVNIETARGREDTYINIIMDLEWKEVLLFFKDGKAVVIFQCNNNLDLLLFDSHVHMPNDQNQQTCAKGAFLFRCNKNRPAAVELINKYVSICDNGHGNFASFVKFKI